LALYSYQAGASPKIGGDLNQAAVEQLVQQEQARQAQMMFLSKLAETAFEKCVTKPDTALSSREVSHFNFLMQGRLKAASCSRYRNTCLQ